MTHFRFRLRFHIRDGDTIGLDAEEVVLASLPDRVTIKIKSGEKGTAIRNHSRAALVGGPFQTEDQAIEGAARTRNALLVWAVRRRFALDLGDDRLRSRFTPAGLALFQTEQSQSIRNDIHGLDIYECDGATTFVSMTAAAGISFSGSGFERDLQELLEAPVDLNDKLALSAELYTASLMEASFRARFLTLTTAIEALLTPADRGSVVHEFIRDTQKRAASLEVDDNTRQSLQGSLSWLNRESIGQAGRALAKRVLPNESYLGLPSDKFFGYCYEVRSQIVHSGKTSDKSVDLFELANVLSEFTGDLLSGLL